uniref:Kinesin motor domain-containing protein n=1 Tax=Populus trichocarpa TaxID=3694 RepID=A0A2K2BHF5_POPTR
MEKIRVAVRVRPAVTVSEDTTINGTCRKVEENCISLHKSHGTPISGISYAFDHVFDESCTNSRVYELLTKDLIHAARGYAVSSAVNRHFGETNMNARSSRSHTIFRMVVVDILSDAASLKRQKLEIEEQSKKLQYELEREKLEMELEEARKSHKERYQCIKEEQMKIDNLNTRATSSDRWKHLKDAEKYSYANQRPGTECWETEPGGIQWQQHCLPRRCFWNPYLDSIQMTPAREVQSFPSSDVTPGYSTENYKVEVQNLNRQPDLVLEEKNEVEACLQFCFRHFSIFNFLNRLMIQFLKVYRERYDTLERECWLLKEERDSSLEKVSESSKKLAVVVDQKEKHFEGFEH